MTPTSLFKVPCSVKGSITFFIIGMHYNTPSAFMQVNPTAKYAAEQVRNELLQMPFVSVKAFGLSAPKAVVRRLKKHFWKHSR